MSCPRRASSRSNAKCLALVREEAMAALAEAEPLPAG